MYASSTSCFASSKQRRSKGLPRYSPAKNEHSHHFEIPHRKQNSDIRGNWKQREGCSLPAGLEWAGTRTIPSARRTERSISKANTQKFSANSGLTDTISMQPKSEESPLPARKLWSLQVFLENWSLCCWFKHCHHLYMQSPLPPSLTHPPFRACLGEVTVKNSSFFLLCIQGIPSTLISYCCANW